MNVRYWHKADIGLRGVNVGSGGKAAIGADSPYRIAGLTSAVYCRVCVALEILRSVSRVTIFSCDRRDYSDRGHPKGGSHAQSNDRSLDHPVPGRSPRLYGLALKTVHKSGT